MNKETELSPFQNCDFKKKLVLSLFLLILFIISFLFVTPDYFFVHKYKFVVQPEILTKLGDFQYYYYGGFMLHHKNPSIYDKSKYESFFEGAKTAENTHGFLNYPPLIYCLVSPMAKLNILEASKIWFYLNHLFLISSMLFLFFSININDKFKIPRFLFYTCFALIFSPTLSNLLQGQVNILLLFLLSASIFFYSKGYQIPVGICLGIAISLKIFPAVLILFFLLKREFKTVGVTFLSIILIHTAISLLWSPVLLFDYFNNVLFKYVVLEKIVTFPNQSILAVLNRTLSVVKLGGFKNSTPIINAPYLVTPLRIVFFAVVMGVLTLVTLKSYQLSIKNKKNNEPDKKLKTCPPETDLLIYSLFIVSIFLLSPMVWVHHLVLMLVSIPLFYEFFFESKNIDKFTFIAYIILSSAFWLIGTFNGWVSFYPRFTRALMRAWFMNSNYPTFLIILTWVMMALIIYFSINKISKNEEKVDDSK